MLDIAYDPALPRGLRAEMEREARGLGLPLDVLERLGQREALCRAFVLAARAGDRRRMAALAGVSENALASVRTVRHRPARPTLHSVGGT